jgi:hypothetical protein
MATAQNKDVTQELIIDQVKKTVVYLQGNFECREPHIVNGVQAVAADGTPIFDTSCAEVGTGFIFIYPTPELGQGVGVPLLITSKHLVRHQRFGAPKGAMQYYDTVTAFANTKEPHGDNSFISPIPITVKENGFLECSIDKQDPEADLAICPISISDAIFDFKGLGPETFVTESKIQDLKLNETDEVLFSGLFLPYHGAKKNYPIVRHGRLALIPKEKIPWTGPTGESSMQDLYLAEITSWGGNSGSPVFVRLSGAREQGGLLAGVQYLLLGVMMGYFNSDRPATLDTAAITDTGHFDVKLSDNSGIAAIVPAEKINEIIGQPRIKAYVSIVKGMSFSKAGKTPEAESSFKDAIATLQSADAGHPLLKQAFAQYAAFLQSLGRYPEASFQSRLANAIGKPSTVPDDQLR